MCLTNKILYSSIHIVFIIILFFIGTVILELGGFSTTCGLDGNKKCRVEVQDKERMNE